MSQAYFDTAWLRFNEEPASAVENAASKLPFLGWQSSPDCLTWQSCTDQGHTPEGGPQETAHPGRGTKRSRLGLSGARLGQTVFTPALSWARQRLLRPRHRRTSPSAQCCFLPAFHKGLDPYYSQSLVLISSQSLLPGEPICNHAGCSSVTSTLLSDLETGRWTERCCC